jgi:chromosome segregation ATPase
MKQMSAIISYCRFIFTELTDFQSVVDKTKAYTDECNLIKRDIDELSAKLFSQNSELTQIKPIIDKCNARTSLLKEKLANAREIKKKLSEELDEFEKGEQTQDAEAKDINDKQQQNSKKLSLYEKLIIRSPQRLNSDTEKNEARINELEKLTVEITKEISNEKRNLFEREKFIDSSEKIFELIVNLYENSICNANNLNKDIESIKEEIMNLSFDLEQKKSIDASLTAELDRVKEKTTTFHDQIGLEIENFKEKLTKLEEKIKLKNKELDELKLRKELVSKQKIEQSRLSNEILNKALETVKYYQNMEYIHNVKVNASNHCFFIKF